MAFPPEERQKLLNTYLVGKKTITYLEAIGMNSLSELAKQEAGFVCSLIAHESGLEGWATHTMALRAIENAIQTAKKG